MKKMIQRNLGIAIILSMFVFLLFNFVLQINIFQTEMIRSSNELFWQIDKILEQNDKEIEQVKNDFKEKCLIRAKAAAYILQYRPSILDNQDEMKKVEELLQIDEFHVFDKEGTLYAGTEPKYFGINFNSGKQIQFFLPILEDTSLELCQNIEPNTAEGKMMQYAAVWQENKEQIIQIGMNPQRIMDLTKNNELSYIFSMLTYDKDTMLLAVSPTTHQILASTNQDMIGKSLTEIGIFPNIPLMNQVGFHSKINGQNNFCVPDLRENILLIRCIPTNIFYNDVYKNTLFLALNLTAIAILMMAFISRYLEKNIITSIDSINTKLNKIAQGNLDERIHVKTTPEFDELSNYINEMVESLLDSTNKMSIILDMVNLPIGAYEYGAGMERVRITRKIPEILNLSDDKLQELLSNYHLFENNLVEIKKHPLEDEENVFCLSSDDNRYIKMESFKKNNNTFGILLDVSEDIIQKKELEQERDYDLLTGLYSRRAFYRNLETLFQDSENLKNTALVMIDSDNLKFINDHYGHNKGDRYLRGIADCLSVCTAPNQMTARLSGDEFAVIIYNCESRQELLHYLEELTKENEKEFVIDPENGCKIILSFSMGYAIYEEDGDDYHTLLQYADSQMYENKRNKKRK